MRQFLYYGVFGNDYCHRRIKNSPLAAYLRKLVSGGIYAAGLMQELAIATACLVAADYDRVRVGIN